MLVFSATHHFIDLCASKVRYCREGRGGGGGSQAVNIYPQNSQTFPYPASSGFSRPDANPRRERNDCEEPSASLIEPPSSAMGKKINFKRVKPV